MIGRILAGMGMIVFVGAIVVGATGAFFSDTETSTGNTFAAGDIDLRIDNESYAIDNNIPGFQNPTGALVANPANSWALADLVAGTHKFFNFSDLKPGDVGEDTISIHVGSNNAWMCAAARITADLDNSITEPEDEVAGANNDSNDGTVDGDLDSGLNFAFWADDGDNVFEVGETFFLNGTLANMGAAGAIRLADDTGSILGGTNPIPGGSTFYIGKAWCFGALAAGAVAQDGLGKVGTPQNVGNTPNGPLIRGTGVTCDGSGVGNIAQTDSVEGDMQFYAVQSRNNPTFTCSTDYTPAWPNNGTLTINKIIVNDPIVGLPTGTGIATDFQFQVNGGVAAAFEGDASNAVSVAPGNHSVVEVAEAGYITTYSNSLNANADCNNLAVPANGNVTCTVTNTFNEIQ